MPPAANVSDTPVMASEGPKPAQNLIWIVHLLIGVFFFGFLVTSFTLYSKRKREGRRSAVVATFAPRQRSNRLTTTDIGTASGQASTSPSMQRQRTPGQASPATGTRAAMTMAMSQFRGRNNSTTPRTGVRFAESNNHNPRGAAGGTMEYLSPMC